MKPHRPRKRFGQHFLRDENIIARLVRAIAPAAGDTLAEIGPGEGVLTAPLLQRCGRLLAIELDRDLAASLAERLGHPPHLEIIQADVLKVDLARLHDGPLRVVGNLPYNISTPVLFHLLSSTARITDMHFMLQKEVVDRLVAEPGSRAYGRLSVMARFHCRSMQHLFDVPPGAFWPPPKVDSAVIRMIPEALDATRQALAEPLAAVVRQAFGMRRKTLRNALRALLDEAALEAAGVSPAARAEVLSLEDFLALAEQLQARA